MTQSPRAGRKQRERIPVDIVVPTLGRPSLARLLETLAEARGPAPNSVILVHDAARSASRVSPLPVPPAGLNAAVQTLEGPARGPAAARNTGWRASTAEWIVFVDDDVLVGRDWLAELAADLSGLGPEVAASQGRLRVPLRVDRKPTDWDRNVAGLEGARWITADMAYRRSVFAAVGGFDERFPRAFREDSDLALRVTDAGYRIVSGGRRSTHPVRPADRWVSVRLEAGNRDDALMRALHGRGWRKPTAAPMGRLPKHVATTVFGLVGLAGVVLGRPAIARAGGAGWVAGTVELAWARISPGPRTRSEVSTVVLTSPVLPVAATWHRLAGEVRARRLARRRPTVDGSVSRAEWTRPEAVLFDRDGTLVVDVPYNGDPAKVVPMPSAREAVERLRAAGVPTAVVSNQSGVARGLLTPQEVEAVNRRVEELLGPLGPWLVCFHGPDDGCACRKPHAGLVERAAAALGVRPSRCVVIGDIAADVEAAAAAGARGVLVPTAATRPEEVVAATAVADDLAAAVDLVLAAPGGQP